MLKFFRKIRQKLLSENKFSKYLIYAVGEIVLMRNAFLSPVRDNLLVEISGTTSNLCAVRYNK
ncbi:MAG: hypothetical protein JJ892_00225 [Balneola sp.]|nr:hypothetical protein [Balneola sp.]MBO6798670.1 hypothetical protein [Balneola sp.]MBO6871859.1 hypothetical protein [Balneola sp.]